MNPFTALIRRIRPALVATAALLRPRTRVHAQEAGAASQLDRFSTPAPALYAARPPAAHSLDSGARIPILLRSPGDSSAAAASQRAHDWSSDRHWNRLFSHARTQIRKGDWLGYRDTRLEMAAFMRRHGHLVEALILYLDVWYLDVNGPRDSTPGGSIALLGTEDPPFDPDRAAPRSPARRAVRKLMHALELQPHHVQSLFLDSAAPTHRTLDLPMTPSDAWRRIGPELLF